MKPDRPAPHPEADLAGLIGPTPDAAVALIEAEGDERIPINDVIDASIPGPTDLALIYRPEPQ
jgi:hypothetical protein